MQDDDSPHYTSVGDLVAALHVELGQAGAVLATSMLTTLGVSRQCKEAAGSAVAHTRSKSWYYDTARAGVVLDQQVFYGWGLESLLRADWCADRCTTLTSLALSSHHPILTHLDTRRRL